MRETLDLTYGDCAFMVKEPSKLVPGASVLTERFKCPKCKRVWDGLGHITPTKCTCGLTWTRFGNTLTVEDCPPWVREISG